MNPQTPAPTRSIPTVTDAVAPQNPPQASPAGPDDAHWQRLIGQVGSEVSLPLSAALERVTVLATTGKIDRAGLRALRDEIERARRAGMIGQQLARFASGRIRQTPEQLSLTQMLREVLLQRGREATAHRIEIRQALRPAEVVIDATLAYALLQAIVDWGLDLAHTAMEFRLDIKAWPRYARLVVRFEHPAAARAEGAADRHDPVDPETKADTMAWRLVQQIAWTLGLSIDREAGAEATTLAIEFPRTVSEELQGVSVVEVEHGFGASDNSKPLAGSHVLVVVSHRDVRAEVRESIRHMGLLVDFVNSVEEAEVFCRDALPHAILYESVLINERFQKLRSTILAEVPGFVFLQIDPEGQHLELSGSSSQHQARVGRQALMQSLPSALLFELARSA